MYLAVQGKFGLNKSVIKKWKMSQGGGVGSVECNILFEWPLKQYTLNLNPMLGLFLEDD